MINNNFKNKIFYFFSRGFFLFGILFICNNTVYAIDTYTPLEDITIGEFIYNDDYTPTSDDCKISIYSPTLVVQVDGATMTDEGSSPVTGWHYYEWTTLATEGKYPAFITCGSSATGDLFKLDKSFIVKAPVVTDSSIANAVDVNTSADINTAVSDINSNTDTETGSLATTLSGLPATIWNYTTRTLTSFGSLVSDIVFGVWFAIPPGTPEVKINNISDSTSPKISASVNIKNESNVAYEYQYEWCVTLTPDKNCINAISGTHNTAARKLLKNESLDKIILEVGNVNPGNYYFILVVPYSAGSSYSRMPFTATAESSGGGGGGGGGGNTGITKPDSGKCDIRSDFNCDAKVNSIDFSILLYFWKSNPPFKNQYVDMNKDGKVDSVDFSILLYNWEK